MKTIFLPLLLITFLFSNKSIEDIKVSSKPKVKPIEKVVKPKKVKPRKNSNLRNEIDLLIENFKAEKLLVRNQYKIDLEILKKRKRESILDLKTEFNKKRKTIKNKYKN